MSEMKELRLHLRYDSGQQRCDEEGELSTVLLVERHQTAVCVCVCWWIISAHTHTERSEVVNIECTLLYTASHASAEIAWHDILTDNADGARFSTARSLKACYAGFAGCIFFCKHNVQ